MAPILVLDDASSSNSDGGDSSSPPLSPDADSSDPPSFTSASSADSLECCDDDDRLPKNKHARRPFHWSRSKTHARHRLASSTDPADEASVRPHHRALYAANLARHRVPRDPDTLWWDKHHTPRKGRSYLEHRLSGEDVDLARCHEVRLPGQPRVPSLERQDAFCEGRRGVSLKKQSHVHYERARGRKRALELDDEELYRMGLLYDNEHERGEEFGLNMIDRCPVQVRVVPARGRRGKKGRKVSVDDTATDAAKYHEWDEGRWNLDLALSFAQLGDDEALAEFLMAPGAEERVVGGTGRVTRRHEGITVVYELEEDSCWTQRPEPEDDWAFLDDNAALVEDDDNRSATTTVPEFDAWVVLGSHGS